MDREGVTIYRGEYIHARVRLRELCEAREDAETAFRALFQLGRDELGRPKYPEFTWELAEYWAYDYPVE